MVTTLERTHCGPQVAGQLGLSSAYARQGLMLLSGPQIDPGFEGTLVVRTTNLAPRRITLAYEAPFLTVCFFKLNRPVEHPYAGARQGQTGLGPKDIEDLSNPDSPTLGGDVETLTALARDVAALARDVAELKGSVNTMTWAIGIAVGLMTIAITVVGIIAVAR